MILVPLILKRGPSKVLAGSGLLSRTTGHGSRARTVLYATSGRKAFTGAWWVEGHDLGGGAIEATVSKGFVNGLEPMAPDGNLISEGIVTGSMEQDRAWMVVRVQIDPATGKMRSRKQSDVSADSLRVEIADAPVGTAGDKGEFGHTPLAMFQRKAGVLHIYQIAYFSYRHSVKRRNLLSSWRHFFHVA